MPKTNHNHTFLNIELTENIETLIMLKTTYSTLTLIVSRKYRIKKLKPSSAKNNKAMTKLYLEYVYLQLKQGERNGVNETEKIYMYVCI